MKNGLQLIKRQGRGIGRLLFVLALCLALCVPSLADDDTFAADMRLEMTMGDVALTNSSGRNLSLRKGMKLYDGYIVNTEVKGNAYIKLDDEKIVKLDENSQMSISKNGDVLELKLEKGMLFFNIATPLEANETLNISTSTMVTGIRGTSGYIIVHDANSEDAQTAEGTKVVTLAVLDGTVEVEYYLTADGSQKATITVSAGQSCTLYEGPSGTVAVVNDVEVADIPLFVASEIASDEELKTRISMDGGLTGHELNAMKIRTLVSVKQVSVTTAKLTPLDREVWDDSITPAPIVEIAPQPTPAPTNPAPPTVAPSTSPTP